MKGGLSFNLTSFIDWDLLPNKIKHFLFSWKIFIIISRLHLAQGVQNKNILYMSFHLNPLNSDTDYVVKTQRIYIDP